MVFPTNDGSSLLDSHAPVRTKIITSSPVSPWLTTEVLTIRKVGRQFERRYRHRKKHCVALLIDRQILMNHIKEKRKLLGRLKTEYLREIADSAMKSSLFKIAILKSLHVVLIKKPKNKLPRHDSLSSLCSSVLSPTGIQEEDL